MRHEAPQEVSQMPREPCEGHDKDADSYECESCGAVYNTILPRWRLPACCWRCGERNPWEFVGGVEYVPA